MAERNSTPPNRKQEGRPQPISRHPLFPAIVALWFAAVLGVGSLALSTSLIERAVLAGRIDSVLPAAMPPLGSTARLLISFLLGMLGGAMGWALARRIGRERPAPHVFTVADLDETMPWPGIADGSDLGDDQPQADPRSLPVTAEPRLRPAEAPAAETPAPVEDAAPVVDAVPVVDKAPIVEVVPVMKTAWIVEMPPIEEAAPVEAAPATDAAPVADADPPRRTAAQRIASADPETLSHVELLERLAIALQRRQQLKPAPPPEPSDAVIRFPGIADRQNARFAPLLPVSRPAPQETEKALREALAALQRMSGGA